MIRKLEKLYQDYMKGEGKMDYNSLRKMNESIYQKQSDLLSVKEKIDKSITSSADLCKNSNEIILQIENDFAQKIKLTSTDIPFLFLAVALQTMRWILQPKLNLNFRQIPKDERLSANEIKKNGINSGKRSGSHYEKPEINKYKNSHLDKYSQESTEYRNKLKNRGKYQYLSWIEILFKPVPYDAMVGSENIAIKGFSSVISPVGKQLYGKNHHTATLGHDPILGWIFGTMNIASAMITFCDLQTFPVIRNNQLDNWEQQIDYLHPSNLIKMFNYCINSFSEDSKRLPAAVARQAMHIQSDKYTKDGLQIPTLSPELSQKLIDKGWNSNEAERLIKQAAQNIKTVGIQFSVSIMINLLIRSLYLFFNPNINDVDYSALKIEQILTISGIIAETSNITAVAVTRDINRLDIGGIISVLNQIAFNIKIHNEIEREFLREKYYKKIMEV